MTKVKCFLFEDWKVIVFELHMMMCYKMTDDKTMYHDLEDFDPQLEPLLKDDPGRFVIFPINVPINS